MEAYNEALNSMLTQQLNLGSYHEPFQFERCCGWSPTQPRSVECGGKRSTTPPGVSRRAELIKAPSPLRSAGALHRRQNSGVQARNKMGCRVCGIVPFVL